MMKYEDLIKTVSIIVENEDVYKRGLVLTYTLSEENHKKMNEELFYKSNPITAVFVPSDEFEVELGGITVKFVKLQVVNQE